MNKILFIGGGKMMQAIAGGLQARGAAASPMAAVEPNAAAARAAHGLGVQVFASAAAAAQAGEFATIVLAVKPQVMREALQPFAGKLTDQLVISIAAGVRTTAIIEWLDGGTGYAARAQLVRAMPNTPALIQAGITGLFAPSGVSVASRQAAETLLAAVGKTTWFDDEAMLDAVTAISGSGPAYVFYFIEALEVAAMELGFTAEAARRFALETFRGAALLAASSHDAPSTLRANVTSKNGTTEAAIALFEKAKLNAHFVAGVRAAALRARALGDELSDPKKC